MFKPHVEDIIWKYQQGAVNLNNWKLFYSCRVYYVTTKTMVYYLLVEKMYPFTNNVLHQLWLDVRLQIDYELVLLVYKVTVVFNKVNASKSRVTTAVRVSTAGWIKWLEDPDIAILGKTQLLRGRKPTLDYFKLFECKCFILNTKDDLTKFDLKSYEGVFLGYSQNSKAYIILNKHTMKIKESLNVTFDETPPPSKTSPFVDYDLDEEEAIKVTEKKSLENDIEDEALEINEVVNIKESRNHSLENFTGNLNQRTLRS
nr:retrovirus-related Pol polyprotein from transposon TNT 1-94 [Tanacetum cinerariifolium]